ncbi:MAG: 60S ribosomal protein L22 [Promethearchaeota archaeon]
MAKKTTKKEESVPSLHINADQMSFNNDSEIDDMARFLEERITPAKGLKEVIRSKNNLELKMTKKISKRNIKMYLKKFLHRAGLGMDFRVICDFQGRNKSDFQIYPNKVYEV